MGFDIGVLSFSYDLTGEFMQNIMIIDRDQVRNHQTRIVDRDHLISALVEGLKVSLVRKWPGMNLTPGYKGPEYAVLRRVDILTVDGKYYLKASNDISACDDMG